jgi:hypothetical protein
MTAAETTKFWETVIPLLQALLVAVITAIGSQIAHAIASRNRGHESQRQNNEILAQVADTKKEVAEVKGQVSKLGTGDGGNL